MSGFKKGQIDFYEDLPYTLIKRGDAAVTKQMDMFGENEVKNGFTVTDDLIEEELPEGSEPKFFITVAGVRYLVKDSSFNQRRKQKSLAPFCECAGSNFIRYSGLLDCQETFLG